MFGAGVVQLRALSKEFGLAAETLLRLGSTLGQAVGAEGAWSGHDATAFRENWSTRVRPWVTNAATDLTTAAATLDSNADAQELTSSANSESSGSGPVLSASTDSSTLGGDSYPGHGCGKTSPSPHQEVGRWSAPCSRTPLTPPSQF